MKQVDETTVNSVPKANPKYEVKRGPTGSSIKYDCLRCGTRLTSALMESGNQDWCPHCGVALIVPGEKEKQREAQRQLIEQRQREKMSQRKKEEADEELTKKIAGEAQRTRDLQLDRDPLREWLIYAGVIGALLVTAAA